MPLAPDRSGGGREEVDQDIITAALAASRSGGSRSSSEGSIARTSTPARGTGAALPSTVSGHSNPVPSVIYGPTRAQEIDREIVDQLAMKAGALTTVPEVEEKSTGVAAWDAAIARRTGETPDVTPSYGAGARAGNPAAGIHAEQEAADQAEMDAAFRGFKEGIRNTRRAVNQGGSMERVKALTAEKYAAMSPRQKAAVELNSMLVEAVKADLAAPAKGKNPGGKEYDAAVEEIFTGEGKTAPYAPNTIGVLENIGWSAPATDLEDILSGKLGFTREDINDLGEDPSLNPTSGMRDKIQSSLVKAFTAARKEPIQGKNLLSAKQELLDYENIPGFTDSGREVVPGVSVGKFIQSGFDLLANSNSEFTAEQIIADARANLDDKEFQAFLNFVDINSRDAKKFRQPLGTNTEQTYFDPVEFRKEIATVLRKAR